ncbi:MAG: pseudouridine synthase [Clostridia bacterium]
MVRLNKFMADCGVDSRRACDEIITEGRVKVNGKVIRELGVIINELNDSVMVDGHRISEVKKDYYIMLHKPKGYVTTVKDDKGRKTVMDLINVKARLFPIGRLDFDTEGLLLLTNDGDLAQALTHPSNEVSKTYVARIKGKISETELQQLRNGVIVEEKQTGPSLVKMLESNDDETRIELTITEGRNHQIKKMLEVVGKEVLFLKRTAIGDLKLGGLSRGQYKYLSDKEIEILKAPIIKKSIQQIKQ